MEGQQARRRLFGASRAAHSPGSERLARLLARYGEAIEADLAFRGWDVAQLWRQRRWRFLLNLIDHLPTSSFFVEACADDEEAATALLASKDGDAEPRGPRLAEWTPERDELVRLCDRIGELIAITVQLHGQQLKVPPRPRPVTALDRARADKRRAAHDSLVRRLLPPSS